MVYTTTDGHPSGRSASSIGSRGGNGTALQGMKEICRYVGKSDKTVHKYIRVEGFPASKVGGEWSSDKAMIDEWRRTCVAKETKENFTS
jgi:predicted DNA-binding transcriptional regulator AlpA